jgi:hypothetical protein
VPPPEVTPEGACEIPEGAIHLDFDAIDTSSGAVPVSDPTLAAYLDDVGFVPFQNTYETIDGDGTRTAFGPIVPGSAEGDADVSGTVASDGAGSWLGTSSPPNALRAVGPGHFSIEAYRVLPEGMAYVGFNLGLGWYGEGFEDPDYVVYEVTVQMLPIHEADGSVTTGAWPAVQVTLGSGPRSVNTCVFLENTEALGHDGGVTWLIDVVPLHLDGSPITRIDQAGGVLVEIDDVFYGSAAPTLTAPNQAEAATTAPTPTAAPTGTTSPYPWVPILLVAAAAVLIGGVVLLVRRRPGAPTPPEG